MTNTPIVKAEGVNDSEKLLAQLCDKVFLKLWAYANPQKQKGNESACFDCGWVVIRTDSQI